MPLAIGGGAPNSQILRNARANILPHMNYLNWLCASRDCLVGSELSYADLAAAATISVLDFLGKLTGHNRPLPKTGICGLNRVLLFALF